MGRLEKRRYKRKLRLKAFVGLMLCLTLLLRPCGCGWQPSGNDGQGNDRPIFGVYGVDGQVIKLEFAGSEVSINKSEWARAYETLKGRLAKIFAR